jgi:chromosome partitioning protein
MRIVAVVNQKGGCGKTTTAINLAGLLAASARKVLLIDMDPQGHATLGVEPMGIGAGKTIRDVLLRRETGTAITLRSVTHTVQPNLDLVPSDTLLSGVPEELAGVSGRENRLAEALAEVRGAYHYVIIDCPPQIGLLTFNALMACTEAIITIDPSFFSLHGIGKMLETIEVVGRWTGHEIETHALVTLYSGRTQFAREVLENIRQHLGKRVFDRVIRHSVKLAEAASHGMTIGAYTHRCVGYEDYEALTREILAQEAARPVGTLDVGESDTSISWPKESFSYLQHPSAPVPTKEGVIFTLDAPGVSRVQLAGDFNSWVPDGNEMRFVDGIWQAVVPLAPGRYRYRYVVDGQWQSDPLNDAFELSPYGERDSVLVLDESSAAN